MDIKLIKDIINKSKDICKNTKTQLSAIDINVNMGQNISTIRIEKSSLINNYVNVDVGYNYIHIRNFRTEDKYIDGSIVQEVIVHYKDNYDSYNQHMIGFIEKPNEEIKEDDVQKIEDLKQKKMI